MFGLRLAARDEKYIFGSQRPGYPDTLVDPDMVQEWVAYMKHNGVVSVCCLLTEDEIGQYYEGSLLQDYRSAFGVDNVCWAPVQDRRLCDQQILHDEILPFLVVSDELQENTLVHCSAGSGRTGHVLAAWLVHGRGYTPQGALDAVFQMGRHPDEAVRCGNATQEQLMECLRSVAKPAADHG